MEEEAPLAPYCIGSKEPLDPDQLFSQWSGSSLNIESFNQTICDIFSLSKDDPYEYLASSSTTLAQAQRAINAKRRGGLHAWYRNSEGEEIDPPPLADIEAYIHIYHPSTHLEKALKAFSQAKKSTLRHQISSHLSQKLYINQPLLPSKKTRNHTNPYYDLWAWSCRELEWAGPYPDTVKTNFSHHILPIFYHHFGCVCPSYQALRVIAQLAQPTPLAKNKPVRPIFDIGSGNGYWTYMLRNFPVGEMKALDVRAVDNQTSLYRTMWIRDTEKIDGDVFLKKISMSESILLLVYPQAGGVFTETVLRAFRGDTIVIAGTQNGNGFTGFTDFVIDEWIEKNLKKFKLEMRFPLPSFAGKDDALFVFFREGRR